MVSSARERTFTTLFRQLADNCLGSASKLVQVRALVRYAAKLDSHTENALKVIAYFDALVEHRADVLPAGVDRLGRDVL
jgi:hypothetical protein